MVMTPIPVWLRVPQVRPASVDQSGTASTLLHIGSQAGLSTADVTPPATGRPLSVAGPFLLPRPVELWQWSYKYLQARA